jgi:hypothetical protein
MSLFQCYVTVDITKLWFVSVMLNNIKKEQTLLCSG